ncbi:MAG: hypothetical protein PHN44_06775 [Candidatus Marinimicrobia bacterium]|nr:hypothetical protein [Candidatus Neomarinimicrobiota bacterium]
MNQNPIFKGLIEKGKIKTETPGKFAVYLAGLEGKRVEVIVRKEKSKRSLRENSYYWGVVIEILSNFTGYESEEMHEALKFKFLRTHEGEALESVKSTTKLNTAEFEDYLERIRRWAAQEYNCFIPLPNEVDFAA